MPELAPATRLYGLVARRAPLAVIFRRGPTRHVELLRWNLTTNEVEAGQWLKGRIYERRSDLSPDGAFLAYFAGKYETPLRTWTAISRPPFLTALAMWPKGDAWGGGGLFKDQRSFLLNHKPNEMTADPDHQPVGLRVLGAGEWSGHGEDDPIQHVRLMRDGWQLIDNGAVAKEHGQRQPTWITFDPPVRYRRGQTKASPILLERSLEGIHERQGRWYVTSHVIRIGNRIVRDLGRSDWADWGPNGDLLVATDGRLYRLDGSSEESLGHNALDEVADLRAHTFEPRAAPPEATRW
jgi:hypothetical protein